LQHQNDNRDEKHDVPRLSAAETAMAKGNWPGKTRTSKQELKDRVRSGHHSWESKSKGAIPGKENPWWQKPSCSRDRTLAACSVGYKLGCSGNRKQNRRPRMEKTMARVSAQTDGGLHENEKRITLAVAETEENIVRRRQ
jgi:hypothetical protein